MSKKERKEKQLLREELVFKYQVVGEFISKMSIVYEKSFGLFNETVPTKVVSDAVSEFVDLKNALREL